MKRFRSALLGIVALMGCNHNEGPAASGPGRKPAAETNQDGSIPPDSPQLKRIRVEPVQMARLPAAELVAPGKIEPNPGRVSRIALPLAGRVRRVMVSVGDAVQQGTPVLALDSPEIGTVTAAYRQAQARVAQARSALAKAEADLSRAQDLYANRAIAQKEVLSAQSQLALAKSDLAQAQAAEEESARRLRIFGISPGGEVDEVLVRAPLSGKVLDLTVAAGEYRNDTSAPVMTMADLSSLYMAADVPETSIRLVHMGERVVIRLAAYPDERFSGRVARIADTVDPATRTIKVRAELLNRNGRLRPEMFGEIRLQESVRDVIVVPGGAIVQTEKQPIVYREKQTGVFEPVPVVLGDRDQDKVVIVSGLRRGDRVVTDGVMLLRSHP